MKKNIFLTIDDCPSDDFKEKIDYLHKKEIPSILFCLGSAIQKNPRLIQYAIEKGYIIGNHGWSHAHFSDLNTDQCLNEIKQTDDLINELYLQTGINRKFYLFRFPYLDKGGYKNSEEFSKKKLGSYSRPEKFEAIQSFLRKLNYQHPNFKNIHQPWYTDQKLNNDADIYCTFDQREYYLGDKNAPHGLSSESAILRRIDVDDFEHRRSLNNLEWSDIILIHDHNYTTNLFYKIINRYIEKNFNFILPEIL